MRLLMAFVVIALPVAAATPAQADVPDFRIGIQLADNAGNSEVGIKRSTAFARLGDSDSPWAGDANNFDPDAARIELVTRAGFAVGKDFRIGAVARDGGSHQGTRVFTPWASEGGGLSDLITDDNGFDPDQYQLRIEFRPMPEPGEEINDFRLRIQAVDGDGAGEFESTPWASQGGGISSFALDPNGFDPNGFRLELDIQ